MGKGRGKHYEHEERLLIIARYDESKKTVQEFCEQEAVNSWTLTQWLRDRRCSSGVFSTTTPRGCVRNQRFIKVPARSMGGESLLPGAAELCMRKPQENSTITLRLGLWSVEVPPGFNQNNLTMVIAVLEAHHEI
ncbi:MAG: hypothetical protein H8D23_03075 [Candidatus Brocadiales bacterium]|nr:hypothetical protein [Candidatus Brocadiales bacterium]